MKKISIRELHERTGMLVRESGRLGEIDVTDRGVTVARIVPVVREAEAPYFSRRKLTRSFQSLQRSGKLSGGTDSTDLISEGRDQGTQ